MRSVVFWQQSPSMHQGAMLRALAECSRVEVVLVTSRGVSATRAQMGWFEPSLGRVVHLSQPSPPEIRAIVADHPGEEDVHIFSGLRAYPFVNKAFRQVSRTRAHIGVLAEAPDRRGLQGLARHVLYRIHQIRHGRRIALFLVMGEM